MGKQKSTKVIRWDTYLYPSKESDQLELFSNSYHEMLTKWSALLAEHNKANIGILMCDAFDLTATTRSPKTQIIIDDIE
jgi:hypothetical protein